MTQQIIEAIEKKQLKSGLPAISVGDTIDVHVRIIEGAKERIQVFSGVVIAIQGKGLTRTVTVRRIVANEGVERVFKIHSPRVAKVEIVRQGHVRRSKLYYLRDRVGKKRRLRDRRRGLASAAVVPENIENRPEEQQPEDAVATEANPAAKQG